MLRNYRGYMLFLSLLISISSLSAKPELLQVDQAQIIYNQIHTSGQPNKQNFQKAAELGYQLVINLRSDAESGAWNEHDYVESLGMNYLSMPIAGVADLNKKNLMLLNQAINSSSGPVLIHDAVGNRVAAMFAMDAFFNRHYTADQAIEFAQQLGLTSLQQHVRSLLFQ